MGFFTSLKLNSLEELFEHELRDLYDAEQRILEALPKMEEAATTPELRSAFAEHRLQTEGHVERLKRVFRMIGREPSGTACEAAKGLIAEGDEFVQARGEDMVRDAALIIAAQRVEHYEISAYGSARTHARQLGHEDAAQLLQVTLDEEADTDARLTELAESGINLAAQ